ncbi:MAG: winged helix-turn-helix domain-containing protein [Verrucomicrobiia bacterium]
MNADKFNQLDRVIHEKGRLAIMSLLAATPQMSFTELRNILNMTDGNLTSHLKTLQYEGYVAFTKSYENSRSLTTYSLTEKGRKAFENYLEILEQILKETRKK